MKVISKIIRIMLLLNLFGIIYFSKADILNSSQSIGDSCDLGNNQNGICQELRNCEQARKLYAAKKFADIKFCKAQGYIPLACCPQTARREVCSLGSNQNGVCKEMKNCGYAKKLLAEQKISKIKQCDFNGQVPVVCCPNSITPDSMASNCKIDKVYNDSSSKRPAHVGEFPFFAAIGYKESKNSIVYRCSGSLISDDVVLVPAHCVCRRDNVPITVKLGKTSINNDPKDLSVGEDVAVQSIILHPDYMRAARQNDIALIKLNRTATPNSKFIKPICLSASDENIPKNFDVTGLLALDENSHVGISNWLLKEPAHEYSHQKCKELLKNYGKEVIETQFCGINPNGTNTCQAGPVSYHTSDGNVFLYGMGSYGMGGRCGSDFPDVYTKISMYIDWIYAEVLKFT